ncbi:hypothetical protein GCM10027285_07840 [Oleiagrimonas citrea]
MRLTYWPSLPGYSDPVRGSDPIKAFDTAYRCGAAPDSHRIPYCVRREANTDEPKIWGFAGWVNAKYGDASQIRQLPFRVVIRAAWRLCATRAGATLRPRFGCPAACSRRGMKREAGVNPALPPQR